jgi:hypothetical protein
MARDSAVSKWSVKAANTFGRRSFIARAGGISVGALLGSAFASALFPETAMAQGCHNEGRQNETGESVMCAALRNNNSHCARGEFNGGCWYACPEQRLIKCFSGHTQFQVKFTDCCRPSCTCRHINRRDGYHNNDTCCNFCEWHGSGRVVCRMNSCTGHVC